MVSSKLCLSRTNSLFSSLSALYFNLTLPSSFRELLSCSVKSPSSSELLAILSGALVVDDIAALEDILGEIILYKILSENIIVYYIMSALYFILFY